MKIHKSSYQQMDDLFKEARQEKPVMNLKEVEKIVSSGEYIPTGGVGGFRVGLNTLIIVSGIVISSLLTYFTLREDQVKIEKPKVAINDNSAEQNASLQVAPAQNGSAPQQLISNKKAHVEPALTKADKERPLVNSNNFVASNENNIVTENALATENVANNESEMMMPVVKPMNTKMLRGMFTITFPYNDDSVTMKLNGDEIAMLSINNHIVQAENYSNYDQVISEGRSYLAGQRRHKEENNNLELIGYFDTQLRSDKILPGDTQYIFELTSSQLMINKTVQSNEVFKKYKKLYEDKTGKVVTEGSVYKFEKGKSK